MDRCDCCLGLEYWLTPFFFCFVGLKCLHVTSADEAYKVLTIGKKNLQVACTKLNHNSSRSHCIFTIKVLRVVDKEDPRMARVSM